ncbi:MAG: hypothetical protein ACR2O8_11285 [Rhizobiaceae bacterium]
MEFEAEVSAALDVMQAHIEALNAKDETGIAATLHFPHYRLSGAYLKIWNEADSYFSDFRARSGAHWARSSFDDIRVLQAAENKVHLDAEINRYDTNDVIITTFCSLWVITNEGNRWAAKFRSSFAAK